MATVTQPLTLDQFLALPDTEPPSELIHGNILQKPVPQGEHSLLQGKLCEVINQAAQPRAIAYAFPELRCNIGGDSIVPDIAVFRWSRIPRTESGRIANRFDLHPDWSIEILSPDQSQTRVLSKLLHCSEHGTALGWLLDPTEETILIVLPEQRVRLLRGDEPLPVLGEIDLSLTASQVFGWLVF